MSHARLDNIDNLRIVEYATRDQAQQAVNTLSNQNLMGRLVYVREVGVSVDTFQAPLSFDQDRESEPRFTGQGPPTRGGFDGGMGRGGGYGGGGGGGGGYGGGGGFGGAPGGGGRQIYVSNVCALPRRRLLTIHMAEILTCIFLATIQCGLAGHEGSFPPSW